MRLTLRSVYKDQGSAEVLYDLMRARSTEDDPNTNISHRKLPSWGAHLRFFRSHPYRLWFLIRADGVPAGSLTMTKLNEIGIVLFRDYRGLGIGRWAIDQAVTKYRPLPAVPSVRSGRWLANINPKNIASIALFNGCGFELIQHTYAL